MRNIFLGAAAAAALAIPGAAFAQDAGDETGSDLSGFYVGVNVALDDAKDDASDQLWFDPQRNGTYSPVLSTSTNPNVFSPGFCKGFVNGNSLSNGCYDEGPKRDISIKAGYDGQMGNIVAGLVGEYTFHGPTDATTALSTTPASYTIARKLDGIAALRGRLGYSPNGRAGFFYVTGGVGYGKMKHAFSTTNATNTFTETNDDDWKLGGQIGAGVELLHSSGFAVNIEYLYNKFRDRDYYVAVGQGTAPATGAFGTGTNIATNNRDFDFHSFRVGMSYKF
jgi:outer membrane immunogenic protein